MVASVRASPFVAHINIHISAFGYRYVGKFHMTFNNTVAAYLAKARGNGLKLVVEQNIVDVCLGHCGR